MHLVREARVSSALPVWLNGSIHQEGIREYPERLAIEFRRSISAPLSSPEAVSVTPGTGVEHGALRSHFEST